MRHQMTAILVRRDEPALAGARAVRASDCDALARLMLDAYRGTIDDEGETPEQALAEAQRLMGGAYGEFLAERSVVVERDGVLVHATLLTRLKGRAFLAMSMTAAAHKRSGLARAALVRAMNGLLEAGEAELDLVVTPGNEAAEALYRRLGFVVTGVLHPPAAKS